MIHLVIRVFTSSAIPSSDESCSFKLSTLSLYSPMASSRDAISPASSIRSFRVMIMASRTSSLSVCIKRNIMPRSHSHSRTSAVVWVRTGIFCSAACSNMALMSRKANSNTPASSTNAVANRSRGRLAMLARPNGWRSSFMDFLPEKGKALSRSHLAGT